MILRILQTALAVLLLSGSVAYADGGRSIRKAGCSLLLVVGEDTGKLV